MDVELPKVVAIGNGNPSLICIMENLGVETLIHHQCSFFLALVLAAFITKSNWRILALILEFGLWILYGQGMSLSMEDPVPLPVEEDLSEG
ncbi:hypothetical protein Nepgr_008456 [Nepenthes gracilis]|uniref:Uncharacterized protein n=1 Tax=Nepenthes gracilis TaxID=150966 RepID=A0AAD3XJG4_NEPGR|nr:hypothetical protein Nepgr_008456 [Nepenthes gracilis]